jgi:hypothetical protein
MSSIASLHRKGRGSALPVTATPTVSPKAPVPKAGGRMRSVPAIPSVWGGTSGQRTAVIAEYGRLHSELDLPVIAGPPGGPPAVGLSDRFEMLAVEVRSLLPLGTRQHLGFSAAWQKTSATSANAVYPYDGSYDVGVTYYPRSHVSVALSAGRDYAAREMLPDRQRYLLEANWFATRSLAFGLGYESTDTRIRLNAINVLGSGGDSDGLRFSVSWRY